MIYDIIGYAFKLDEEFMDMVVFVLMRAGLVFLLISEVSLGMTNNMIPVEIEM